MDADDAAPDGTGFQLFSNTAFEVGAAAQSLCRNALFEEAGADGASVDGSSYATLSQSRTGFVQQDAAQQPQAPQRQPPQRRPSHDAACQAVVQQTQAVGAALQNEAAASAVAAAMLAAAQQDVQTHSGRRKFSSLASALSHMRRHKPASVS